MKKRLALATPEPLSSISVSSEDFDETISDGPSYALVRVGNSLVVNDSG